MQKCNAPYINILKGQINCLESIFTDSDRRSLRSLKIELQMHRSCVTAPPLQPIDSSQLISVINPSIAFPSVPSSDNRLVGPFSETISSLFEQLSIPLPLQGHFIVPCLVRQIPVILEVFPDVRVLPVKALNAFAQASLRTVILPSDIKFPYVLKFSVSYRVTSATRTVTPWTACAGPELSQLLTNLLPRTFLAL